MKDEGQEVNGESHSNDRVSFMVQSKVVSVEKGNIIEKKPSTEVHKSIYVFEQRSSHATREKLFHVNMQRKNTMVDALLYYDNEKNLISASWMQYKFFKNIVHPDP